MEAFFGYIRDAILGPPEHTFTYNVYNEKHVTGIVLAGTPNPEAGMAFEQFQVTLPRGEELSEESVLLTISDVDPDDATKKGMMLILKAEPGCQQRKVLFQEWRVSPNVGAVPFLQLALKGGKAVKQSIRTADGSVAKQLMKFEELTAKWKGQMSPEDIYTDGGYYFNHLALSLSLKVWSEDMEVKLDVKRHHWERNHEMHVTLEFKVDGEGYVKSPQEAPYAAYRMRREDWMRMDDKARNKARLLCPGLFEVQELQQERPKADYLDIITEVVEGDLFRLYYCSYCKFSMTFYMLVFTNFDGTGKEAIVANKADLSKPIDHDAAHVLIGDLNLYVTTSGDKLEDEQKIALRKWREYEDTIVPKRYDEAKWQPLR